MLEIEEGVKLMDGGNYVEADRKFKRALRNLEVLEAEEYFSKGQKGSSAMPHKRNPIISERVTGIARLLRGNAMAALENVADCIGNP